MDPETFRRDGIVFPAGRIDVAGFTEGYGRFQTDSLRLRGRETYLKPHLVSAWLDQVVRRPAIVDAFEQIIGPDICRGVAYHGRRLHVSLRPGFGGGG